MKKVTREDIKDIAEYEKMRHPFRQYMIELKKIRRVPVGDVLTFVFENRDTIVYQIQEMMRAERIVAEDKIQKEIDVYNELIPADNELSATMFIEIDDQERLRQTLPKLVGIESAIYLKIAEEHEIRGVFEPGRSTEDKTSTVHYIKFPFTPEQVRAMTGGSIDVSLEVRHAYYQASTQLTSETKAALVGDLSD